MKTAGLLEDEKGKNIAASLMYMLVGLVFILLAYTYVAYPVMKLISGIVSCSGDPHVTTLYTNELYVLGAVGLVFSVGMIIWFVLRLAKKEVFEFE